MAESCHCGRVVFQRTAWTESNAGRRFVSCVKGRLGCNYFRWIEDPVCSRDRAVICGLLGRIRELEGEIEKLTCEGVCNDHIVVKKQGSSMCSIWLLILLAFCFGLLCIEY